MVANPKEREAIVEVKQLKNYFNAGKKTEFRAVEDVSFSIYKGETFGLVGESGPEVESQRPDVP